MYWSSTELLSFVPGIALDWIWSEALDVLKIHINGGEHWVLKGAKKIFEMGIKSVVASCKNHTEMFRVVDFLLKYDYEMYLSGEPVDTSLRGNRLLGHLKNIIEETGRKHLQAMQRTKSDADWLWLTCEFDGIEIRDGSRRPFLAFWLCMSYS
eukprot:symbB.v1.2.029252.t1/scaffold3179.1/size61902/1